MATYYIKIAKKKKKRQQYSSRQKKIFVIGGSDGIFWNSDYQNIKLLKKSSGLVAVRMYL